MGEATSSYQIFLWHFRECRFGLLSATSCCWLWPGNRCVL